MAETKKVTLKRFNGTDQDTIHPKTEWDQIESKPATFTPTSHTLNSHSDVNAVPTADGQVLTWDANNTKWIASATAGGGVSKSDLQNLYIYGKASAAITKGQAVQFDGAQGDHILIKPAVPSEINSNPDYMIGIAETSLSIGDFGYVLVNGRLILDTSTYTAGDILYFASAGSTAGALTTTEPTGGEAIIQMAAVSISGVGNGEFVVRTLLLSREIHEVIDLQDSLDAKVNKSGDTMTDTLTISAAKTVDDPLLKLVSTATGDGDAIIDLEANDSGEAGIIFRNPDNTNAAGWFLGSGDAFSENFYLRDLQNTANRLAVGHNGNVGIGTDSPDEKLHIANSSGGISMLIETASDTAGNLLFGDQESNAVGRVRYDHADNTISLWTSGSEKFTVNGNGDVGIGTTTPGHKLEVGDLVSISTLGTIGIKSDGSNYAILIEETGEGSESWGLGVDADGDLNFYDSGSSTPSVVFNDGGNVGIGTTTPSEKLEVAGDVLISGTGGTIGSSGSIANAFLKVGDELGIDPNQILFTASGTSYINSTSTLSLAGGGSGATTDIIITADHKVGIGTTDPAEKLQVTEVNGRSDISIHRDGNNLSTNTDIGRISFDADYNSSLINYAFIKARSNDISNVRGSLDFDVKSTGGNLITGLSLYGTSSGVNVGIGTTTPSNKLHIVGDTRVEGDLTVNGTMTVVDTDVNTTEQWIITNDGTGPAAIINQTGAQPVIDIQDDGVSAFYIEDGGNVGIGTTDPTKKLEVAGDIKLSGSVHMNNSLIYGAIDTTYNDNGTFGIAHSPEYPDYGIFFTDGTTDSVSISPNGGGTSNPVMKILGTGNVGIGTTSPSEKLQVSGNIKADNLYLGADDQTPKIDMLFDDHTSGIVWDTRIEIGKSDDFDSNTPSYVPSTNAYGMNIKGNSDGVFFGMEQYSTTNFRPIINWGDDTNDSPFSIRFNNSNRLTLDSSGNLVVIGDINSNGYTINTDFYHTWTRTYTINTTTPATLLYKDGGSLPNGGVYRFTAHIPATGTENMAQAVFWNENGTWKVNVTGQSGTSSNHPEFIVASNVPTLIIDHPSDYTISVLCERMELGEGTGTDNAQFAFGAGSYLSSVGGVLRYNSSGGSDYTSGNTIFHDGYHPNADKWTTARTITLGGDLTGSVSLDGSANVTLSAQVVNGSHTHDDRYYTESEADGRFINTAGDTMTGTLTYTTLNGPGTSSRDKVRLYSSSSYAIGMQSNITFGGLNNDWAMTFQFNDDNDRGFWWGDSAHSTAQGAMSLTTNGLLTVASGARIGYGESDTTSPVSGVINLKTSGSVPDNTTATYEKGLTIVGGNQRLNIDVSNVTNGGAYIQTRHESTAYPTAEYTLALNPQGGNVTINGNTAWHSGNDGSGSGLDADTVDGLHASSFVRSDADDTKTGDLVLSDAALSYEGQSATIVPIPQGGAFATTSPTLTGYLKITLPVSWTNTMMSFFVDVYEYTNDETFTVQLAGYNYGSGYWVNTTANLVSASLNRVFNVRFGHDGSKCAIYIGESNTTWSYPQVRVRDFLGGYSGGGSANWADGWAVGFTTTLGTITDTQSLESVVTYADSAGNLNGYDWTSSGKNVRATEFYADNWFRNYNANEGLYNEATQAHWYSKGAGNWTVYTTSSATELRFETSGQTRRGSVYADNGNNIGFLDEAGAWSLRMDDGNTANFTGSTVTNGDAYGRSVNGSWSSLYRWGGIYFTWDSDDYGTNTHHSIRSTYGDSYGDNLTMNSFNHIRFNIDSNNNNTGSVFEVGANTTGTGNVIFQVNDSGNVSWTGSLTGGTVPWARVTGAPAFVTSSGVTSVATGGGLTGGTITSTGTISHADTSSQASVDNSGATVIQDVTLDTYGHVTGLGSVTLTAATVGAATSSHSHYNLLSDGSWASSPATIASGDRLVIVDASATPGKINHATLTFGTSANQFLANNGTWINAGDLFTGLSSIRLGGGSVSGSTSSIAIGVGADARSSYSTAVGGEAEAGVDSAHTYSSAFGYDATALGAFDTAIGEDASVGSTYDSSTAIGSNASVTASNMFRLGGTNITNLACSDTTISTTSDVRDKADFGEVDKALDLILNLEPVTYVRNPRGRYEKRRDEMNEYETMLWKEYGYRVYDKEEHAKETKKGDRRQIGFKAQDVAQVMKSIYGSDNYAGIVNIDYYDQDVPEEVENRYSVEYARLVPFLVKAMQEQQKQIEELKQLLGE